MKIKTKKARLIVKSIVCIILALAILIPATMFSLAEDETAVLTEPKEISSGMLEYYDLKKGVYTSKEVTGPNSDGTYDVTIDAYTSDVTYISKSQKGAIDIMVLLDNSASMTKSFSGNVLDESKQAVAKRATQNVFTGLVNAGAGTSFTANVCVYTFANTTTLRTKNDKESGYLPLNGSRIDEINGMVNKIAANGIGGTDTRAAFEIADTVITARQKEQPDNTQIVLFVTDGVPSLGVTSSGTFEADFGNDNGTLYANAALKHANKLKQQGVTIFSVGVDNIFKKDTTEQTVNTLCQKITDGYRTSAFSSETGTKILEREAFIFMNIMSSGWLPVEGAESMKFNWNDYDASSSKSGYNNSQKDQIEKGIYKKWARNEDSWQLIPQYYTIAPDNGEKQYYFGDCTDEQSITNALYNSIVSVISTHVISEGSLLGDYSIKDTVSDYFEIKDNSLHVYQIPYSSESKYNIDSIEGQGVNYGAENRIFVEKDATEITSRLNINLSNQTVEIGTGTNDSTVIDTIIVDNLVNLTGKVHSGNKLRITYKIRPKDSFMGGSSVPTHDYANSGIYKGNEVVQSFDKANSTETNPVPKMSVELVWTKQLTIRLPNSIPLKKVFRKKHRKFTVSFAARFNVFNFEIFFKFDIKFQK